MYPMKLKPALKDYVWGGKRFIDEFGVQTSLDKISEVWALSAHNDGPCTVMNGEFKGEIFADVIQKSGINILGSKAEKYGEFPILVKLIDAADDLSVQVHPDDDYALLHENDFGKTEAWFILDALPGAKLVYGFKEDITKDEFEESIKNHTLTEKLNYVPVKKGDLFFIDSGTIHAIGKGILLAEIQQSSNVTYRVYDYDRLGNDGKARDLHVEKALAVTKTEKPKIPYGQVKPTIINKEYALTYLVDSKFFMTNFIQLYKEYHAVADITSFIFLLNVSGECVLSTQKNEDIILNKGEGVFIPAGTGEYILTGTADVLEVSL